MEEHRPKKLWNKSVPVLNLAKDASGLRRYSYRTEQVTAGWSRRCFFGIRRYPRTWISGQWHEGSGLKCPNRKH
jgi:hypothetical protein